MEGATGKVLLGVCIFLAAVMAHIGCLQAIWFMDDAWQIVGSRQVYAGEWFTAGMRSLTYFTYWVTFAAFGMESWAFHFGNLMIHGLLAVSIFLFGGEFLESRTETERKWFPIVAALIFAVHPLASEVTHYVRARDHELVGLFSFLAAVFTLNVLRQGPKWMPSLILVLLLGALSKEQGVVQGVLSVAIVMVFYGRDIHPGRLFAQVSPLRVAYSLVICALLGAIIVPDTVLFWFNISRKFCTNPDTLWHTLTQFRVFWACLFRAIIPLNLCPDHQIAMTVSWGDWQALLGGIGIILLLWGIVLLARGKSFVWAFFLAMAAAPLLVRFGYIVTTTLMVEYRIYPGLPWIAMILSLVLCQIFSKWPLGLFAASLAMLAAFAFLTAEQSWVWKSHETLVAHILKIHPYQLRALLDWNGYQISIRDYRAVLSRSEEYHARWKGLVDWNNASTTRRFLGAEYFAVRHSMHLAEALLHERGPEAAQPALKWTKGLIRNEEIKNPELLAEWYLLTALTLDKLGKPKLAGLYRLIGTQTDGLIVNEVRIFQLSNKGADGQNANNPECKAKAQTDPCQKPAAH